MVQLKVFEERRDRFLFLNLKSEKLFMKLDKSFEKFSS